MSSSAPSGMKGGSLLFSSLSVVFGSGAVFLVSGKGFNGCFSGRRSAGIGGRG